MLYSGGHLSYAQVQVETETERDDALVALVSLIN
jgi:hypothetical protein